MVDELPLDEVAAPPSGNKAIGGKRPGRSTCAIGSSGTGRGAATA
jgi:hypothetical protein